MFTVELYQGTYYLHHNGVKVGWCQALVYEEKYGSLKIWLEHIAKRTEKRIQKIEEQRQSLLREETILNELLDDIKRV